MCLGETRSIEVTKKCDTVLVCTVVLKYENVDTFPDVVWYGGEGGRLAEDRQSA